MAIEIKQRTSLIYLPSVTAVVLVQLKLGPTTTRITPTYCQWASGTFPFSFFPSFHWDDTLWNASGGNVACSKVRNSKNGWARHR